jgi:hypothetical protein
LDLFTDLRESHEDRVSIRTGLDRFTKEQDPLALMQAFVLSMNVGVYPPVPPDTHSSHCAGTSPRLPA